MFYMYLQRKKKNSFTKFLGCIQEKVVFDKKWFSNHTTIHHTLKSIEKIC